MKSHGWALKTPRGNVVASTFAETRDGCWSLAFEDLGYRLGKDWLDENWRQWRKSIQEARKLGYTMIKVRIVEVGK